MVQFLRKEEAAGRLRAREAQDRMDMEVHMSVNERGHSRFASKFGISASRAVSQMIDLYGFAKVAECVHSDWNMRLLHWIMRDESAESAECAEWDATLSDGLT